MLFLSEIKIKYKRHIIRFNAIKIIFVITKKKKTNIQYIYYNIDIVYIILYNVCKYRKTDTVKKVVLISQNNRYTTLLYLGKLCTVSPIMRDVVILSSCYD